jgi:hypothetical protein
MPGIGEWHGGPESRRRGPVDDRRRVANSTVNTVISFTAPFIASIPAEELGAPPAWSPR